MRRRLPLHRATAQDNLHEPASDVLALMGRGPSPLRAAWEMVRPAKELFRAEQRKPTIVLLSSTILLVTWRYAFYYELFENRVLGAIVSFLAFFVLAGVVPALIVKLIFRERLTDYGVGLGVPVRTLRSFLIMAPVLVVIAYVGSHNAGIRSYYPITPNAGRSPGFFGLHALTFLLYYLGWEFHFRGFLQHGLSDSMGTANAVFVQVMVSTLLHIGNPGIEVFAAIVGGLWWGFLACRTRSLLSGLLQHSLLGLTTDLILAFSR